MGLGAARHCVHLTAAEVGLNRPPRSHRRIRLAAKVRWTLHRGNLGCPMFGGPWLGGTCRRQSVAAPASVENSHHHPGAAGAPPSGWASLRSSATVPWADASSASAAPFPSWRTSCQPGRTGVRLSTSNSITASTRRKLAHLVPRCGSGRRKGGLEAVLERSPGHARGDREEHHREHAVPFEGPREHVAHQDRDVGAEPARRPGCRHMTSTVQRCSCVGRRGPRGR